MSRNNCSTDIRPLELLAPARNADVARQAVLHGADAVYIGASGFGARAAASNSLDDIRAVVEFAHQYGVRVYVTVNTIVYDRELKGVERMIRELYHAGVDALIVQDLGILRMDIPPIDLHASTQCDIRTPEKARFLESLGFSQLVLPRELSLEEIAGIRSATSVALESFVHGALCVSYSGDCQASQLSCGRSANRGECAQICRYAFDLYAGASDSPVVRGKHLLSLRDLNRADSLEAMAAAGISSFKIEGRLKDPAYVKNIVALYRRRLDALIDSYPERYCRASYGVVDLKFTPQADRSFNRGFTSYFLKGTPAGNLSMASPETPKSRGQLVGKVRSVRDGGRIIEASLLHPLTNGDGLGYFSSDDGFVGFRLNRVEGTKLYPARPVMPTPGTELWRNSDKAFADILDSDTATRYIPVTMMLRRAGSGIALDIADNYGHSASAAIWPETGYDEARSPQEAPRRRVLERLGDSIYRLESLSDNLGSLFIPASELTQLRRRAIADLDMVRRVSHRRPLRRAEDMSVQWSFAQPLTRHDNVANRFASQVYTDHGAVVGEKAAECEVPAENDPVVMTTRYCLRRELGACLREGGIKCLPEPLTLVSGSVKLRPEFDCANCRMRIHLMQ